MRKIITIISLSIIFSFRSFAQSPTLTAASINPVIGNTFIIYNCDTAGVQPGPAVADTSWDFSGLHLLNSHSAQDTGFALAPASTEPYAIFPASNIVVSTPTEALLAYYIESDSTLSQDGLYTSTTEYTAYADPMDQLQFPFTYSNVFTDTYNGFVVYTPAGGSTVHAINSGSITATADAFGSLKLPGGIVFQNTLRVHSIQSYTDSVNLFGTPVVEPYTLETYAWYTPGYHNVLFTIATATGAGVNTKQVSYSRQIDNPAGVSAQGMAGATLLLFPNPVNTTLHLGYTTSGNEHVRISLSDVLGRETAVISDGYSAGAQQVSYNTAALPNGLYLVCFQSGSETSTRKIEVRH